MWEGHKWHDRRKNNEIDQDFGCNQSYIDLGVRSKNTIDYISSGTIEACKIQYLWRVGIQDFYYLQTLCIY